MDIATVRDILKKYGHERLELEFRLGHRLAGKFVPGVTAASWAALKSTLDASPCFIVVTANTRELICDDGSKFVIPIGEGQRPFWMHKKRIVDTDAGIESAPWTCRTSVSLEETSTSNGPPSRHTFERLKQRWSYVYKCWSIDLTRVQSNLPHQLDNDGMSFEIEIELKDTSEFFARPLAHIMEWGWSIVQDVARLSSLNDAV